MEALEKLGKLSQRAIAALRVGGALTPILVGSVLLIPILLGAARFFGDQPLLQWFLVILTAILILTVCGGFLYFARTAPERLQSETYQIRHEALQVIQVKSSRVSITPSVLEALVAESRREIEAREEEVR